MSLIEKCFNYTLTHGGDFPNAKKGASLPLNSFRSI